MKTYIGKRFGDRAIVSVRDDQTGWEQSLEPRYDLRNHSPTGFEWGYAGSGPAQLALAMCADACGDGDIALAVYQQFKDDVIAKLDREKRWEIKQVTVITWIARFSDPKEAAH